MNEFKPEIMAPAGDKNSFLAALAAEADAIYVGLKHFSARMQAKNFSISELAALANMARSRGVKVYVAMNTLVKPGEPEQAGRLIDRLSRIVKPHALILQDIGLASLARQAGFKGELHLSTLANMSHPAGFSTAKKLGFKRVVLPRELNLDEIKTAAEACPSDLSLELFIHGALCYCVSGRCYWSSALGGKSGLRGRCVQPCRRIYSRSKSSNGPTRIFSCMDLSIDVLARTLLKIPQVKTWKIEGRKKGPHYVFYTVKAYRLLRDEPNNPESRKFAESLLEQALGRPTTHSVFLPQRQFIPASGGDTASGLAAGVVKREGKGLYMRTRIELLPGDLVRVGYEDEQGHRVVKIRRRVPKRGRLDIGKASQGPASGTMAFLVDRREPGLMKLIKELDTELEQHAIKDADKESKFTPTKIKARSQRGTNRITLSRSSRSQTRGGTRAVWLEQSNLRAMPKATLPRTWWALPPVIWPDEEDKYSRLVSEALKAGARTFMLNAPWQVGLFPPNHKADIIAGPYCNIANGHAVQALADIGFKAAFISPELSGRDYLDLPAQSPLPLGVVIKGLWPMGISRYIPEGLRLEEPWQSPKKETGWAKKIGQNLWIFPGWEMDLTKEASALEKAGYVHFLTIIEPWPKAVPRAHRTSRFNWDLRLY